MRNDQIDVACRVIDDEDISDFRTVSDCRKIRLARPLTLIVEIFNLSAVTWPGKVGTSMWDGTQVYADPRRHKSMSYDQMKTDDERLKKEIAEILSEGNW